MDGTSKPKDKDKTKLTLSADIKKAIATEIGKRLEKTDKKKGELSKPRVQFTAPS